MEKMGWNIRHGVWASNSESFWQLQDKLNNWVATKNGAWLIFLEIIATYKISNIETSNGMREMQESGKCALGFQESLLDDSGEYYHFNIHQNDQEDSGF